MKQNLPHTLRRFRMNKSVRKAIYCGVFAVSLLAGCDRISNELAHSGAGGPSFSSYDGWYGDSFKSFMLCRGRTGHGVTINGEKRSCVAMSGLIKEVTSRSPHLGAEVKGSCRKNGKPVIVDCTVADGKATINSLYYGYNYVMAYEVCRKQLRVDRRGESRSAPYIAVLDYGLRKQDLDEDARYVLKGAVEWNVLAYKPPNSKKATRIIGQEWTRFTCIVEDKKVVTLTYRELGDVTWNELGFLKTVGFYQFR